jgi:hypothetical protein
VLKFTTAQLLIIYGWCEAAEHEMSLKARDAEQEKRYEEVAYLVEKFVHYGEIKASIHAELKSRGAHPLPRRPGA